MGGVSSVPVMANNNGFMASSSLTGMGALTAQQQKLQQQQQKKQKEEVRKLSNTVNSQVIVPVRSNSFVDPRSLTSPVPLNPQNFDNLRQMEEGNYRKAQELNNSRFTESVLRASTELRKLATDIVNLRRQLEDNIRTMERGMITDAFTTKEFVLNSKGNFLTIEEQQDLARSRANNETTTRVNEFEDKILQKEREINASADAIPKLQKQINNLFEKANIQPPESMEGEALTKWLEASTSLDNNARLALTELTKALSTAEQVLATTPVYVEAMKKNRDEVMQVRQLRADVAGRQAGIQATREVYSGLASINDMIGNAMIQSRGRDYNMGFAYRRVGAINTLKAEREDLLNPDLMAQRVANANRLNPDNQITIEQYRKAIESGLANRERQLMFDTSGYNEMKTEFTQLADMMNSIGGQLNQRGDVAKGNWLTNSGQSMQVKIQSNDMRLEAKRLFDTGRLGDNTLATTKAKFDSLNQSIDNFEKNALAKMMVDNNYIVSGLVEPFKTAINGVATIMIDKSKSFWEKLNDVASNALTSIANHFANNFSTAVTTWFTEWLSRLIPVGLNQTTEALDLATARSLSLAGIEFNTAATNFNMASQNFLLSSQQAVSGNGGGGLLSSLFGGFSGGVNPSSFLNASSFSFAEGIKLTPFANFAKGGMVDEIQNFAKGGMVEQAKRALAKERAMGGGKAILSALTVGEYVIPKNPSKDDIAQAYANVPMLRNMQIENYAKGGMVGKTTAMGGITTNNNSKMETRDNSFVSNIYVTANDASSFRKTRYQIEMEEQSRMSRNARRF
jgi:hypothetical protein